MRLANKVAIVTGSSSGIGLAIAEAFLAEGAKVVFSDLNPNLKELHSASAFFYPCDVSSPDDVKGLIKEAVNKFGRIDIMVNNAGIGSLGGILDTSDETWHKTLAVNLSGVFYGSRAAAKVMKEAGIKGSIINMSSILGKVGFAGALSYCASKGGVVQLTRAAALDLAPDGIRVNAIAPGFIKTAMTKDVLEDEQFNSLVTSSTPLGYVGEVIDIAMAAVYLASDESRYVTGEVLYVDGGWTAK